jgi:predicted ATPase
LHGRAKVTRSLSDVIAGAVDGRSVGGVLIVGEAGMGKSALLEAVVTGADRCRVVRAHGLPLESQRPFAGVHQMLVALRDKMTQISARQRDVLGSVLTMSGGLSVDDFEVAAALMALLASTARQTPVLVAIDDAQWLDPGSLGAVLFAFARLSQEGVALLIATRPDPAMETLRMAKLRELRLGPLDEGASRAAAAARAPGLGAVALDEIVRRSGGVPLAIVELAARYASDDEFGAIADSGGSADDLVERLFGRRVQGLSPAALTAALLAALDEPGELDAYIRAGERLGAGPTAWEEAERGGILRVGDGRADFHHPLLRDAVLRAADPARVCCGEPATGLPQLP